METDRAVTRARSMRFDALCHGRGVPTASRGSECLRASSCEGRTRLLSRLGVQFLFLANGSFQVTDWETPYVALPRSPRPWRRERRSEPFGEGSPPRGERRQRSSGTRIPGEIRGIRANRRRRGGSWMLGTHVDGSGMSPRSGRGGRLEGPSLRRPWRPRPDAMYVKTHTIPHRRHRPRPRPAPQTGPQMVSRRCGIWRGSSRRTGASRTSASRPRSSWRATRASHRFYPCSPTSSAPRRRRWA